MHQRAIELTRKWHVLVKFMEGTSLEELPLLLASEDPVTRVLAKGRLQGCLDSMSAEELPLLLVDTDPLVRAVAGDLLEKSR